MSNTRIKRKLTAQPTSCSHCGKPFPELMDRWPGHWELYCENAECIEAAKERRYRKYVYGNQIKCTAPGCTNFIPEGSYSTRKEQYVCSIACWYALRSGGTIPFECGYCGKPGFRQRDDSICGLHFCSREHYGLYQLEQTFKKVGTYRPTLETYFATFVPDHYSGSSVPAHRSAVFTFVAYLTEAGINSLEDVTPLTVSAFLQWAREEGRVRVAYDTCHIHVFLDWAQSVGLRKQDNPVIPAIHNKKVPKRLPRPYSDEELKLIWKLLEARGNSRLRAMAAIAEEAGIRLGELARLRVQDVDLKARRLFIRLPNKTNRERYALFGLKAKRYIELWLAERNPECGHDSLFHNQWSEPCSEQQIHNEFSSVLCKTLGGKRLHEEGLDSWSIHRLRHTMASRLAKGGANAATIMGAGGWTSYSAMTGYTQIDLEDSRRGYDEAMKRASTAKDAPHIKRNVSFSEFLELTKKPA